MQSFIGLPLLVPEIIRGGGVPEIIRVVPKDPLDL